MCFGTRVSLSIVSNHLEIKRANDIPPPGKYYPLEKLVKPTRYEKRHFGLGDRSSFEPHDTTPGPGTYKFFYGIRNTSMNRLMTSNYETKNSTTTLKLLRTNTQSANAANQVSEENLTQTILNHQRTLTSM